MANDVLAAGAPTGIETARRLLLIWQTLILGGSSALAN